MERDSFAGTVREETAWLPSAAGRLGIGALPAQRLLCWDDAEVDSQLFISLLSSCLAPDMRTMKICLVTSAARGKQREHERNFKQTSPHQLLHNSA